LHTARISDISNITHWVNIVKYTQIVSNILRQNKPFLTVFDSIEAMANVDKYWKPDRVVMRRKIRKPRALLNKKRLFILLGLIIFCLIGFGVYKLLHLNATKITDIEIAGTDTIDPYLLRQKVETLISGDSFYFVPRSNIFFIAPSALEKSLKSQIPTIDSVEIKKVFPHVLDVSIVERRLWAIYCVGTYANVPLGTSTIMTDATASASVDDFTNCYMLDRAGVIYQEAPSVEGSLLLQVKSDQQSSDENIIGSSVMQIDQIENLTKLLDQVKNILGVTAVGLDIHKNSLKDIWIETLERFKIVLTRADDYTDSLNIVKAVLDNEIKNRRGRLDYIDARFGNKVYYKLK